MKKGWLVVLEGIDGVGHSAHASELANWAERELADYRGRVVLTREPTDGPIGALIRSVLRKELEVGPETLALLFAADRMEHVRQVIRPKLAEGCLIICDRYYLSSYAYQSAASVDLEWLMQLNSKCPRPDLTVLLDAPVEVCLSRIREGREHLELFEEASFLKEVRRKFLEIASKLEREGERVVVVRTDRPFEEAHEEIVRHVVKLLASRGQE